jgi:hypothetical protein
MKQVRANPKPCNKNDITYHVHAKRHGWTLLLLQLLHLGFHEDVFRPLRKRAKEIAAAFRDFLAG